jgi:hypothetical protein
VVSSAPLRFGLPLLIYGFFGYFNFLPGGDISALLLIYGFIISLIGFALKYAQLDPLELTTYEDALKLRWEGGGGCVQLLHGGLYTAVACRA